MKIFLDAYDWRAHIGFMETKQEEHKMVKLIETHVLRGTTYSNRYFMDGKRVSEADWLDTFSNVYKTPDDVANAHKVVEVVGIDKVRYTWYA